MPKLFLPSRLKKWTPPKDYVGETWYNFYSSGFTRGSASDALERANFEAALKQIESVASKEPIPGDDDWSATVQIVRGSEILNATLEWIAIHESDSAALEMADELQARMDDCPVVDETLSSPDKSIFF